MTKNFLIKSGFVALIAAGLESPHVKSVVLFAPAGYDAKLIKNISAQVPVTLIWGEMDTIIEKGLVKNIYDKLEVNKRFFFGGRDGITPFHYFEVWKWLLGANEDLIENRVVLILFFMVPTLRRPVWIHLNTGSFAIFRIVTQL